jgi:hypothetical protein
MANKKIKGKWSKKFLHVLHIFWEFLRKIWTTLGKSPKGEHSAEHVNHGTVSHSASKSAGKSGVKKGIKSTGKKTLVKSTAVKSGVGLGSIGIGAKINSLLSTSSAASVGSTAGTTLGGVITAKTLTILLLTGGVALGGLGTYSYVNQENPLNVLENVLNPNNPGENLSQNTLNPTIPGNINILTNSIVPAIGTGSVSQSSGSGSTSGSTGGTGINYGSDDDDGFGGNEEPEEPGRETPSINYTIP